MRRPAAFAFAPAFALALAFTAFSCTPASRAPTGPTAGNDAPSAAARGARDGHDAACEYDVKVESGGARLDVTMRIAAGVLDDAAVLSVTEGAERYVEGLTASSGVPERRGAGYVVPAAPNGCTLHYRFDLAAAASLGEDEVASGTEREPQAPAASWLLRPTAVRDSDRFVLRVDETGGAYASGIRGERGPAFVARGALRDLSAAPYAVFGALDKRAVSAPGATLVLAMQGAPSPRAASNERLAKWAHDAAEAVGHAYGRFPIDGAMIGVLSGARGHHDHGGGRVGFGRAMAGPLGGAILVDVDASVDDEALRTDWVLVHEMIHLGFPSVDRTHRWMEEGLATYWEPLVRARAGMTTPSAVWHDFVSMLHYGLPEPGDQGLDRTPTWGRVYWGGALFCFVTDVEIRKRTRGERSLDDALRAILAAGGDNGARWPIERAFSIGDAATGTNVLSSTYAAWKDRAVGVDLPRLFAELGVRARGDDAVDFDDAAPLAAVRRAMTAPTAR